MLSIGIGEIQKNSSIFSNLTEVMQIIDKRKKHLEKSIIIFKDIEKAKVQVEIVEGVLMEAFFVLTKFYKLPKNDVINDLKTILYEALNVIENKNIDFIDTLICAKSKLQGFGKLSFDEDVKRC